MKSEFWGYVCASPQFSRDLGSGWVQAIPVRAAACTGFFVMWLREWGLSACGRGGWSQGCVIMGWLWYLVWVGQASVRVCE